MKVGADEKDTSPGLFEGATGSIFTVVCMCPERQVLRPAGFNHVASAAHQPGVLR